MTDTGWLWVVLGWLSLPLVGLLGGVCAWRKTYRELPFFFAYVVTVFLLGVVRLLAYKAGGQRYFYVYWYSEFVGVMAASLAIYEVFLRRIFPSFYKVRFYRFLFPSVALAIGLLAFLTALAAHDRREALSMTSRAFDFLRSAVIGFFAALTLLMGRRFAGLEFWVATGFAIQASAALANAAIRTRWPQSAPILDAVELITYDLSCLIWLAAFWKAEKGLYSPTGELDPKIIDEARTWETLLKTWLAPRKSK
ncbi:MAG TPA: hypothetical protein VIX19_19770 [Terriglobales bacterium]